MILQFKLWFLGRFEKKVKEKEGKEKEKEGRK
jgi:hypothetical protein